MFGASPSPGLGTPLFTGATMTSQPRASASVSSSASEVGPRTRRKPRASGLLVGGQNAPNAPLHSVIPVPTSAAAQPLYVPAATFQFGVSTESVDVKYQPEDFLNPTPANRFAPVASAVFAADLPSSEYEVVELTNPRAPPLFHGGGGTGPFALLPTGEVLAVDSFGNRILIMTAPGCWSVFAGSQQSSSMTTFSFGGVSTSSSPPNRLKAQLNAPWSICVTNSCVFVTDENSNGIKRFTHDGLARETALFLPNHFSAVGLRSLVPIHGDKLLAIERSGSVYRIPFTDSNATKPQLSLEATQVLAMSLSFDPSTFKSMKTAPNGDVYAITSTGTVFCAQRDQPLKKVQGLASVSDIAFTKDGKLMCLHNTRAQPTISIVSPFSNEEKEIQVEQPQQSSVASPSSPFSEVVFSAGSTSASPSSASPNANARAPALLTPMRNPSAPLDFYIGSANQNSYSLLADAEWTLKLPTVVLGGNTSSSKPSPVGWAGPNYFGYTDRTEDGIIVLPGGGIVAGANGRVFFIGKKPKQTSPSTSNSNAKNLPSFSSAFPSVRPSVAHSTTVPSVQAQFTSYAHQTKSLNFSFLLHDELSKSLGPQTLSVPHCNFTAPLHESFLQMRCPKLLSSDLKQRLSESTVFSKDAFVALFGYIYENRLVEPTPAYEIGGRYAEPSRVRFLVDCIVLAEACNLLRFMTYLEFRLFNVMLNVSNTPATSSSISAFSKPASATFGSTTATYSCSSGSSEDLLFAMAEQLTVMEPWMRRGFTLRSTSSVGINTAFRASTTPKMTISSNIENTTTFFERAIAILASRPKDVFAPLSSKLFDIWATKLPDLFKEVNSKAISESQPHPLIEYCDPFKELAQRMKHGYNSLTATDYVLSGVKCHKVILASRWPHFRTHIMQKNPTTFDLPISTPGNPNFVHLFLNYLYSEKVSQFNDTATCQFLLSVAKDLNLENGSEFEVLLQHCRERSKFCTTDPKRLIIAFQEALVTSTSEKELYDARTVVSQNLSQILSTCPEEFEKLSDYEKYALLMIARQEGSPKAAASSSTATL